MNIIYNLIKFLFDFIFSFIGLIVILPLLALIAFLIKLSSKGSVFYRGIRSGQNGVPFKIYKFRTMIDNAEKLGGHSTGFNDPRLTKIGKFLRRYKLDELPQLINILKGEMSFVGPRPQVEKYTKLYQGEEKLILSVKPGFTDYSTIEFINLDKILGDEKVDEKYFEQIEPKKNLLRIKYVKKQSFFIDVKILFLTFIKLLQIRKLWKNRD